MQQLIRYVVKFLTGKDWEWAFWPVPFVLSIIILYYYTILLPRWILIHPLTTDSLFAVVMWDSWMQSHWLSELGLLEVYPLGGSLKIWGTRCVAQNLGFSGRSWNLRVPSYCMFIVSRLGFMARVFLSLSYPFWCCYFLSHLKCSRHSTCFWIFLRGNCSICSYTVGVCMGGRQFTSLLCLGLDFCTVTSLP